MTRRSLWMMGAWLSLTACSDGKGGDARAEDAGALLDGQAADGGLSGDAGEGEDAGEPPEGVKGIVKGRVRFADGTETGPLEITIGDRKYKSDNRGVFVANDVPVGKRQVIVTDANTTAAQIAVAVAKDDAAQVDLAVLRLSTLDLADAAAEAEVSDPVAGVKFKLPKQALKTKAGAAVAGPAKARYGVVKTSQDVKAAPGGMRGKMADKEVELESFGMLDLRFYQDDAELELAEEIEVELPLAPNEYADGSDIDVWSFDEAEGYWKTEGKAKVDKSAGGPGVAKLRAKHLSWWGVAEPIRASSCIAGRVLSAAEEPIPYVWVNAVGVDYWGSSWQVTDADGSFCIPVKAGSQNLVTAFGSSGSTYYDYLSSAVIAGSEPAACGGPVACTELSDFGPNALFDECTGKVTNGQDHVLVLSSGDQNLDTALSNLLETHGQAHTVGVHYTSFDGTLDLSAYDAVYLQANANWSGDMPVAGQRQLINWVNCGGGLVTVEWTTWKIGSGAFQLIDAIFPAARTTAYGYPSTETFTQVTPDATLNAGLPESFTFTTTSYSGVESNLNPRPGATIYYDSELDSGLLGWSFNLGRVASFSMVVGVNEVNDENFSRLIVNTLNWVQGE